MPTSASFDEVKALAAKYDFLALDVTATKSLILHFMLELQDRHEPSQSFVLRYESNGYGDLVDVGVSLFVGGKHIPGSPQIAFPLQDKDRTPEAWEALFRSLRARVPTHFRGYRSSALASLRTKDARLHDELPALHSELEAVLHRYKARLKPQGTGGTREWGLDEDFLYVEPLEDP